MWKLISASGFTYLLCLFVSCSENNSADKNGTFGAFYFPQNIPKPEKILKKENKPEYEFRVIYDTLFEGEKRFKFRVLSVDDKHLGEKFYAINCYENGTMKYSQFINSKLFSHLIDSVYLHQTQLSVPDILYFSENYQQLVLWFNLGFPNQESNAKAIIVINSTGYPWSRSIVANEGHERYKYFLSPDKESIILNNTVIQLSAQKTVSFMEKNIFSAFLNSQVFCFVYDPVIGDTFVEEKLVDEWGNETSRFYHVTQKDSLEKNVFVMNMVGDTLYNFRFDGICQDEMFKKTVSFARSDSLKLSVFYDDKRKILRIFHNVTLAQQIYSMKDLVPDYPEKFYHLDIPFNCYTADSTRGEKILRLFFDSQKIPKNYLYLTNSMK